MKVVDIEGVYEVANDDELEKLLMKRYGCGFNAFWLSHGMNEYPTLSLLVKGDLATLNYVANEDGAGFTLAGGMADLKSGDTTVFYISNNRADDLVVINEAVLPFSTALEVAKEFFSCNDLPQSVKWLPL